MKPLSQHWVELVALFNDGFAHDLSAICQQLDASNDDVVQWIADLTAHGVPLICNQRQAYHMVRPLMLLDHQQLMSRLSHHAIHLEVFESSQSTNHDVRLLEKNNKDVACCLAETQFNGKGRFDRPWHSPFADNIYLSLGFKHDGLIDQLNGLSLVVAVSICRAIMQSELIGPSLLTIKWPNDILLNGAKLAGILIETDTNADGGFHVIVGIGLNVNMQQVANHHIDQPWVSLSQITGNYIDRNHLSASIIDHIINDWLSFSQYGLRHFMLEWEQWDYYRGQRISVISGQQKVIGTYQGISKAGYLTLISDQGQLMTFASADVFLLK